MKAVPILLTCLAVCGCPAPASNPPPAAAPAATVAGASEPSPSEPLADEPAPTPEQACQRFSSSPIPEADLPAPAERAALQGCDAQAFYYGIDRPIDFVQARKCAFVERESQSAPVIGGAAILMMLYANGQQVARNLDLGLRFACEVDAAPAELEARVGRLWKARAAPAALGGMDICDDITSGFMGGVCTDRSERLAAVARGARKRAAVAGLPAPELSALERAATSYFETRSSEEVDQTGTLRAAFVIEERARLEDELVSSLEQLRDPHFQPEPADAAQREKAIASALERLNRCQFFVDMENVPGGIKRAGIRETQAQWLQYRSAFIALALALRPGTQRAVWQAWLDGVRLGQLEQLLQVC